MIKKCKCKYPEPQIIGKIIKCLKCNKIISRVRKTFHKKTKIKKSKKVYNRKNLKEDYNG